jgi:hypothetical protein
MHETRAAQACSLLLAAIAGQLTFVNNLKEFMIF